MQATKDVCLFLVIVSFFFLIKTNRFLWLKDQLQWLGVSDPSFLPPFLTFFRTRLSRPSSSCGILLEPKVQSETSGPGAEQLVLPSAQKWRFDLWMTQN